MTASAPPARPADAPASSPPPARAMPGGSRRWLARHWWALLIIVGGIWGLLWPFSARPWAGLASWGDPVQQYWSMAWTVHALRTDPTQLFNGNIFYPYPYTLAYADHLLGATIPLLPIILLTGNVLLGFNLAVILACVLSALAAYLLLADLTGSRLAGLAAAFPFAASPYMLGQLTHLNVLFAGPIALALWAVLRLWRGGGWRWAALLALAIPWEAGVSAYFFYAQLIAVGVALAYLALAERGATGRRALLRLGAGLAAGLLLAVPVLWPYVAITRAFGSVRSFDEVLQWSGQVGFYLGVNSNNLTWGNILRERAGFNPERFLFPGVVAPALALVGLALSRRRERWLFAALIAVGFALTLGPYQDVGQWRIPLPYLLLYQIVPGFSGMRVTTRFVVLAILGLAGLAGLGVEALARRWQGEVRPRRRRKEAATRPAPSRIPVVARSGLLPGIVAVALLVGAYGFEYRTHSGRTGNPDGETATPVYAWLAANGRGPVLELPYPPLDKPAAFPDLYATAYWRPIIGGYSGIAPPAFGELVNAINLFPRSGAIELLQGLDVEHIVVRRADLTGEWRATLDRLLASEPRVREVARFGDDVIYALAPDPWLARLAAAVPPGEAVVLPDVGSAGLRQELLSVYLGRAGHTVWGSGTVGYRRFSLPGDGRLPANAVLAADADPWRYGWLPEEATISAGGLTLYRHAPGVRAARLLNDGALPRATCAGCPAFGLRLTTDGVEAVAADRADGGSGGGAARSALIAFVNGTAGEVTITSSGAARRERLPAGLIVYRTAPLATPATVRIAAPDGGALIPRWARLDDGGAAPPGLVAARPVVALTGQLAARDDGTVGLDLALFGGADGDPADYALSLDIYRRPYGTHPEGHYGYWTIAVPPDGRLHRVGLEFDIARRAASATLDGNWAPVASWENPSTSQRFRASLVIARGEAIIGSVPAFDFELRDWRARYVERTLPADRVYFFPSKR